MTRPFWWFTGASVEELKKRLNEATGDVRLEARPSEDGGLHFRVIGADDYERAVARPDINDSHVCPPSCG